MPTHKAPKTLLREWEAAQADGVNQQQFATLNHLPLHALLSRLDTARREREISGKAEFSLGQPLKLEGDWMIIGDVHIPFVDYDFANLVSMVARKNLKKPRRLLIAGDFFNMDTFSTYAHLTNIPTWAEERRAARGLFDEWFDTFTEIVCIMGNHDRRLQKFTGGAFDDTDIIGLVGINNPERIKSSNYGWCTVESGGQVYRVTHPKNYSVQTLNVADTLANKFGSHIISFHEHHLALGWDRYKRYITVNGGCLVDDSKVAYMTLDDTKSARGARGFVMLRGGVPHLFGEAPFTDWSRWV